jgi:ABC-type polysaccharide/polyol phosphate export systems, permease component
MHLIRTTMDSLRRYRFLIRQLVARDFKVKYKRSVLGVAWSLLYPLLTMAVMAVVFSNVFRFSTPGVSYIAYLLIGLTWFNYFSEASNLCMGTIVANFPLISKVYVPKYLFPLSKCLFVGLNFLMTLIPLYLVILLTGTGLCWQHLLLPYSILCLFLFTLGMGFLLAAAAVFLRDMFYIYGILLSLWLYLTPVMYDFSVIRQPLLRFVMSLNPLYQMISFARTVILYRSTPDVLQFTACGLPAMAALLLGTAVFRRNQDKFVYYM